MSLNIGTSIITKKMTVQKTSITTAISAIIATTVFAMSSVHAAPEITINTAASGSTTMVEQYSDGNTATTITTTPNSVSMQNGTPATISQAIITPSYVVRQDASNSIVTQSSTTVTNVPVTDQLTNKATKVDVITTPSNTFTQVLPLSTAAQLPVMTATAPAQVVTDLVIKNPVVTKSVVTNPVVTSKVSLSQPSLEQPAMNQTVTNQLTSSTSLKSLQLNPTFSKPDIVTAQTKIMKILKNKEGQEMAVPANHVASGDVIEYHTTYTNATTQSVNNINAMVSLPSGIQLLSLNSLLPTLATIDGKSYQTIQPMGTTTATQGNYAGLKWNLVNLDANAAQTVVIRAKVQ